MTCSAILEPREGDRLADQFQYFNWGGGGGGGVAEIGDPIVHPSANSVGHVKEAI